MGVQGVNSPEAHAMTALGQPRNPQPDEVTAKVAAASGTEVKRNAVARREETPVETAAAKPEPTRIPGLDRAGTRFGIDKTTDRIVAQIMNHDREVIKQIPPEELLKVLGNQKRLQGLLFDESV